MASLSLFALPFSMRYLLWLLLLLNGLPALAHGGFWSFSHRMPPYARFVTNVPYQGGTIPQKRTPLAKLPRKGGTAIRALEFLLDARYHALLQSDTTQVLSPTQEDSLFQALLVVRTAYPEWNHVAYTQEAVFYQRAQAQRQLQHVYRLFCQAQFQRERLRTAAETAAATASFEQATQAGLAAQQAQQWARAEVFFARCRALQPTDSASNVHYILVAQQCLDAYFSSFLTAGNSLREAADANVTRKPIHWPAYTAALPQVEAYLRQLNDAYEVCWRTGQRACLYQHVRTLLGAKHLLPASKANIYVEQAYAAVEAYGRRYGDDDNSRTGRQLLREAELDSHWE